MVQLFLTYRLIGCVPVINLDDNHTMTNNNMQYILGKTIPLQYTSIKSIRNGAVGGGSGAGVGSNAGGGEIIGINGKRIATKSCSESSVDGRSSDSTYTSSSGNGAIGSRFSRQSVNSRFPTMERFDMTGNYLSKQSYKNPYTPMTYIPRNQVHLNSTYPKMSYAMQQRKHGTRSNRTYYTTQDTFDESSFGEECNGFATAHGGFGTTRTYNSDNATVEQHHHSTHGTVQSSRRFVNVEKFIQSNKTAVQSQSYGNSVTPSPVNETPPPPTPQAPLTQRSIQRLDQSPKPQKKQSTDDHNENILESVSNGHVKCEPIPQSNEESSHDKETPCSTPKTTVVTTVESSPHEIDLNSSAETPISEKKQPTGPDVEAHESSSADIIIEPISPQKEAIPEEPRPTSALSKTSSVNAEKQSTKSKEIEALTNVDTPDYESQAVTPISRPQSVLSNKSQVIEEDIDGEPSVIEPDRVSEATQEVLEDLSDAEDTNTIPKTPIELDSPIKELLPEHEPEIYTPDIEDIHPSPPRSPTINEIKALSRKSSFAKSCESLYDRPHSKLDIDNSTETSSDYQSSQLNNTLTEFIPVKPQHIPLQRKSKTSCFMKNHRRISPVKQSIKMSQAELFPQNMTRFEKPRDALNKTFDQLDSSSWEIIVLGLKSIVRLLRYHPETLDNQMHMTCIQLTKSVRNLRSQVSRAACQAATELFTMKSKYLEQECDDLVSALLHRTADTNRFLRADATRGLESMCDNLPPPKVLNILSTRGAVHQNALVRTTTAKLLNRLADRLGCDKIFSMGRDNRDKFIITGANLLLEGSLETRSYAKSLFRMLSNHQNYSRLLLEVIPTRTYRNIEKTLKNIR